MPCAGAYRLEDDAALAYDRACVEMHGTAAITNFPADAQLSSQKAAVGVDIMATGSQLGAAEGALPHRNPGVMRQGIYLLPICIEMRVSRPGKEAKSEVQLK